MSTTSPEPTSSAPSPDSASTTSGADAPAHEGPVVRAVDVAAASRRRRAPRYGRFGFLGFLIGAISSLVLTLAPVGDSELTQRDLFFVLLIPLGTAGIFAGLLCAFALDRRSLRRLGRARD